MPDGFMNQVDLIRRTIDSVDSTISQLDDSVQRLDKNSTEMSYTALEISKQTKNLTTSLFWLTIIMTVCAILGVVISGINLYILLK